jgi:hypothetical protein
MPKILLKFKQKNCRRITILFLLFFTSFYAQHKIVISYNEKIDLGKVDKNTHFYFVDGYDNIHLKGNEINNYSFTKPGIYNLKVEEKKSHSKESCTDIHLPSSILVEVSRVKMTFDGKNISFSAPIIKNKNANGIALKIPVSIQTYDHLSAVLNRTLVNSAGIGSSIIATLNTGVSELPEGTHTLEYALSGIVTENSYLMFDFVDANGKIQTVSLLTPVKN